MALMTSTRALPLERQDIYQREREDTLIAYSGTSLIRSPAGLGKSDLNAEVTLLQGANLHGGIQFGTESG